MNTFTLWLFTALLAPTLWALSNVLDSALRKAFIRDDLTLAWVGGIMRLPFVFIFFELGNWQIPQGLAFWMMLLAGILLTLPILLYFQALEQEDASRVALFIQLVPLFTIFTAYGLLGEKLTEMQALAFFVLIVGGLMAALKKMETGWKISPHLFLIGLACLIWSLSDVLFKKYELSFENFYAAFAVYCLGSFLVSFSLCLYDLYRGKIRARLLQVNIKAWKLIILGVIAANMGTVAFNYALTLKEASLTAVLMGIQPLMALILGFWLSKVIKELPQENLSKPELGLKFISFVFIMAGIILLQYS